MEYDFAKDRVIELLNELADEGFQRKVWLAPDGPKISSFDEAICGLFDDTGLGDLLEKQSPPVFTSEIDTILRELDQLSTQASHLFRTMPPASIVDHPKMCEVRCMAAKVLAQMEQERIA
jgi:hypothetical protein